MSDEAPRLPQNYVSNSHKSKERKVEKNIQQVTTGKAVQRKKPLGKKIAETFVGDDAKSVGTYVVFDVMLPAAKEMVFDMVKEGFERFLFGDSRRSRSGRPGGNRGYTNYSQFSSGRKPETRREMSPRARANHDFDDIVLQTRTEAETVLDRMIDLMDQFDVVAVSDLMGLVGITPNYTDEKWGWYSLKGASVSRIRDGYLLDLPPTEPID